MLKRSLSLSAVLIMSTALFNCASSKHQASDITYQNSSTSRAAAMSGGSEFAVIEFDKGSYALSEKGRATLQKVAHAEKKDIGEIKVLAWADREYPETGIKAEKQQVNLADDRASVIKAYLKDDLKTDADIDKHNMAQRPGAFAELIKSEDFKIKSNFENSGAAPTNSSPDILSTKVSKAIVVIEYK